jgi:hypothetical protein
MKTIDQKTLGLTAKIEVPSTVAEFDKLAKRDGACLDEAVNNVVYRGVLASLRDVFLHGQDEDKANNQVKFDGVEQVSKLARKTKPTGRKDKDGADILAYGETEAEYFERVVAAKGPITAYQSLMDSAAKLVPFDPAERERKPAAPKKLAAKYLETAQAIMKGKHLDRFVKDVKTNLGKTWVKTADAAKDAESLGWLVKEMAAWKEDQELKAMVG